MKKHSLSLPNRENTREGNSECCSFGQELAGGVSRLGLFPHPRGGLWSPCCWLLVGKGLTGCYDQIPCFVLISTPHSLSFVKEERRKRKGKEKKEKGKDLFNSYTSSWKILEPDQSRQYLMKTNWLQNSQPTLVKNCYSEVALTTTALAGLLRVCFSTSPGKFAQGFKVFCCCCVCALCQPCFYDTFRKLHGDLYSPISVPAAARGELQPPSPQRLPLSPPTLALAAGENTGMCPPLRVGWGLLPSDCLSHEAMQSCWGCLTLRDNFWRLAHGTQLRGGCDFLALPPAHPSCQFFHICILPVLSVEKALLP